MPSEVESLTKGPAVAAQLCSATRRWLELCLVLTISFGGFLLNSTYFHRHRHSILHFGSNEIWSFAILQEATSLALLHYLLSRRNVRWKDLGLRWSIRDLFRATIIVPVSWGAYWATCRLLLAFHNAYFPSARFTAQPPAPSTILIFFVLVNPFFEELIVRAYLMTEVQALTGSWILAAGLSTLLQASYHIHYGWPVMISLGIEFPVFSIYFAHQKRVTPLILAHGFFDIGWVFSGFI